MTVEHTHKYTHHPEFCWNMFNTVWPMRRAKNEPCFEIQLIHPRLQRSCSNFVFLSTKKDKYELLRMLEFF